MENIYKRWPQLVFSPLLTSLIFIVFICQENMGNFSERLFDYTLPLRGFCTLPSLPRRDIQDGGQSRSHERNVFCKNVCKQSRKCLTHDSSYSFRSAFNAPWNQSMSVQEILLSPGKGCQMSVYKRKLMPCVSPPFSRSLPIDCM